MSPETDSGRRTARTCDGAAIIALALGVAAVALLSVFTLFAAGLGGAAVTAGLASRRRLRRDSTIAGAQLSFLGLALGGLALVLGLAPLVLPAVLPLFA
jgi:hypothetical protein